MSAPVLRENTISPPLAFYCKKKGLQTYPFMTTAPDESLPALWHIIDRGSKDGDPENIAKMQQLYSGVADLYHEFRPSYPEQLVDEALGQSKLLRKNSHAKILEIGCGPGTLTLPLAKRGFHLVAIDPGVGMLEKAKQVCKDYSTVEFRQESFREFSSDEKYDAIIAASSLHWALAGNDRDDLIEKMSSLLRDDGSLLLFWNFPCEPSDQILDKVAEALEKPKPYYFGNGSLTEHWRRMQERVLGPVEDSPFFEKFQTTEVSLEENVLIESFINFLRTMTHYITMPEPERNTFFDIVRKTLAEESGEVLATSRKSIVNVSTKIVSKPTHL